MGYGTAYAPRGSPAGGIVRAAGHFAPESWPQARYLADVGRSVSGWMAHRLDSWPTVGGTRQLDTVAPSEGCRDNEVAQSSVDAFGSKIQC